MDGARDPSAVAVKPAYTADGEWGWFGPNTIPGEQWANHITGEIRNILTAYGLDCDPLDDGQLAALLVALLSDSGRFREGINAVTQIDGYDPGEAFVGGFRVYPMGDFPSRKAGCDAYILRANHSLVVRVGEVDLAAILYDGSGRFSQLHIGGDPTIDPGAPVGEKVFFDGATGNGRVDGDLDVGGETTLESLALSTGANKSSGSVAFGAPDAGETAIAPVFNTLIGADSLVLWELVNVTGSGALAIKAGCDIVAGSVTFSVKNDGSGAVTGGEIRYAIINPA